RTTRSRLMLLAAVSLIGPALLLGESMFGNPIDAPMVAVVAGAMFLCVLLRMAGLVWEREQAQVREQFLRQSASELSAASSREDIYRATISGLADLVVGIDDVHLVVAALSPEGHVVAVEEAGVPLGPPLDLEALWTSSMESMTADGKDLPIENEQHSSSAGHDGHSDLVVCSLVLQERLSGLIVVESALKLPAELRSCVETLSAQVG